MRAIGIPLDVQQKRHEILARHLARAHETAAPLVAWKVDPWWQDLANEFTVAPLSALPQAASVPGSLVFVDGARDIDAVDAAVSALAGADARLVFCEIASAEGRTLSGAIDPIDVTGTWWHRGVTVIDVDRHPVRTAKGVWHVAAGVARLTPTVSPTA